MAHELEMRNGIIEMAYLQGQATPWHGLGQALPMGSNLDAWAAASMPFKIDRSRVRYMLTADAAETLIDESHHVLFRNDTKEVLGLVSDKFKVVQPREALEAMHEMAEVIGFHICTAGTLKGGKKLWVQAESKLEDNVLGKDIIKGKLLIATACDGSMKTHVREVTERVVCANTLSMAMEEKGNKRIAVSHRSVFDVADIKMRMGIIENNFTAFIKNARELAKCTVSREQADRFILQLIAAPQVDLNNDEQAEGIRASAGYRKVSALYNGQAKGSDLAGVKGTAWGLVNAATEYVDHHRGNTATTISNRLDYAWFGAGDAIKTKAFNEAMLLVA